LWGGNSYEFFADAVLQPYEVKEWTEYYMPTFGLKNVTNANEKAAAYLDYSIVEEQIDFTAQINATSPGETMRAVLELVGDNNYLLLDQNFVCGTTNATVFEVSRDMDTIAAGNYDYQLKVYDSSNNIVLTAKVPVKIEGSCW